MHRFSAVSLGRVGWRVVVWSVALLLGGRHAGLADALPTAPMLRIETRMHSAAIRQIAVDAAERYLVTGSDDKTVRVWAADTGRLLQTLRPPIGSGSEGLIYTVAISPDGSTIACGGWTGREAENTTCVYIFDRARGTVLRRLAGLPNVINDVAYSHDGRYLAVALGGHNGVRIYNAADGTLAGQDKAYGDRVNHCDFDSAGRLATTALDGFVRLYDAHFALVAKVQPAAGRQPQGVRFSPDGARLAVGFDDARAVVVLKGADLKPLYQPATNDIGNGNLFVVAWSEDGSTLYAAGRYSADGQRQIRAWSDGGRGGFKDVPSGGNDTILGLAALQGGALAWCGGDPAWGILGLGGEKRVLRQSRIADFHGSLGAIRVSADGNIIRFPYQQDGADTATFSVADRELRRDATGATGATGTTGTTDPTGTMPAPLVTFAGLDITGWKRGLGPMLHGAALPLERYEMSRSLAIAPDGGRFVLGADFKLYCFDAAGKQQWSVVGPGTAWAVNISGDGKLAVADYSDGTIRWYRMSDGQELLAFFPHADHKRWVLWTPSGYYDCSPGGDRLIGWHVNRGADHEADFIDASHFQATYYRPDAVRQVLSARDESAALDQANHDSGRPATAAAAAAQVVIDRAPPVVSIVSPNEGTGVATRKVTIAYNLRSPSGEPVTAVRVLIDGRPVTAQRAVVPVSASGLDSSIDIAMPPHDCQVSLIAENKFAASNAATVRLDWTGIAGRGLALKTSLYVLAVGVGTYSDPGLPQLQFPARDAPRFAQTVGSQKGMLYSDVQARVLTDQDASRDAVLAGLDWIAHTATSHDIAMIFLSGHGYNDQDGSFYFLPAAVNANQIATTGLSFNDIQDKVQAIAGKTVMFIDSCHHDDLAGASADLAESGKKKGFKGLHDINALINILTSPESGAVVFSASTGSKVSWDDEKLSNGVFTTALVEGLTGRADTGHTGSVTVDELDTYITARVKELTGGKQTPSTTMPDGVDDFALAADGG